jgi:chemotaxis regulatin CheY-phosphate phosphatase CheZ
MQSTLTSLNRLIEAIDRAKPEEARLGGEKKILLQNFTSEFQIKTLKEARRLLAEWNSEKAEKKEGIQSRFKKLKKVYKW